MAAERVFTVRLALRNVTFKCDEFRHRGDLAKAVARGRVVKVAMCGRSRDSYLNLRHVEEIL